MILINNDMVKLNSEQKDFCDCPLTQSEILRHIKDLASGKTSGSDGLPADFYNLFILISKIICFTVLHLHLQW